MPVTLGINISALQAQRRLGQGAATLDSVLEHLSSGQRITRASEDAAGLSVATSLDADARVYAQAIKNVNDGVSLISVTDSALSAMANLTERMNELAEQSANGVYSNNQRTVFEKEAQALRSEFNRIIATTDFNGVSLFTSSGVTLQAGYGVDGSLTAGARKLLNVAVGDGSFASGVTVDLASIPFHENPLAVGDFNGDGNNDLVVESANMIASIRLGNGDMTFRVGQAVASGVSVTDFDIGDVNGDGALDIVSRSQNFGDGSFSVNLGNGDGTFRSPVTYVASGASNNASDGLLADMNGDGNLDYLCSSYQDGSLNIALGNGNGSFLAPHQNFAAGETLFTGIDVGDLDGDGKLDAVARSAGTGDVMVFKGNGDGTLRAAYTFGTGTLSGFSIAISDMNGDGVQDLLGSMPTGGVVVAIGNGDGTFLRPFTTSTNAIMHRFEVEDLDGDGNTDIVGVRYTTDTATVLLGNGNGTFRMSNTFSVAGLEGERIALGDLSGDGVTDFAILTESPDGVMIFSQNSRLGMPQFSLSTRENALASLGTVGRVHTAINKAQAILGSQQNRIESAARSLRTSFENLTEAKSRITDADLAEESATLVATRIRTQAATAVLAQASVQPQLALRLLSS